MSINQFIQKSDLMINLTNSQLTIHVESKKAFNLFQKKKQR